MRGVSGDELLRLPVRHCGIDLGRAVDLVLELGARTVVGVEVRCGDEVTRFLPFAATRVTTAELEVSSPLTLLDDLRFYRARGTGLRDVRGASVEQAGRLLGRLRDVVVAADGQLASLVVERDGAAVVVPFDATVAVAAGSPRAAAV